METERGSPSLLEGEDEEGISKCETERLVSAERRRAESEGWMYWSMSGGACSRTRGQKLGI
jgi:hypothetical protein